MKVAVFKSLKISPQDMLKGVSMIEGLWMPKEQILFRYGDPGINFYILLAGQC